MIISSLFIRQHSVVENIPQQMCQLKTDYPQFQQVLKLSYLVVQQLPAPTTQNQSFFSNILL